MRVNEWVIVVRKKAQIRKNRQMMNETAIKFQPFSHSLRSLCPLRFFYLFTAEDAESAERVSSIQNIYYKRFNCL